VNVTTPASVRTSTFLSCESLPRRVSTAFAMSLSLASTAWRAAGGTTRRSFFTDFTPSIPCATSPAAALASAGCAVGRGGVDLAAEVDDTLGSVDADLGHLHPLVGEERDLGLGGQPAITDHRLGFLRRGLGAPLACARCHRARTDECHQGPCRNRSTVPHSPILLANGFNATYSPATRRCLVAEISRGFSLHLPVAVDRARRRGAVRRS